MNKSDFIANAATDIAKEITSNHSRHKIKTIKGDGGFEIWCLTCNAIVVSAKVEKIEDK